MREIKFRAWNKDKKIMVYEDEDNSSVYLDGWCANDIQVLNQTLNSEFTSKKYEFMQYTGLKDKNRKEIYEGDIVKSYYYIDTTNGEQERYHQKEVKFNEISCEYNINAFENLEVIGNIYENKNLLEKENK